MNEVFQLLLKHPKLKVTIESEQSGLAMRYAILNRETHRGTHGIFGVEGGDPDISVSAGVFIHDAAKKLLGDEAKP